MSDERKKKAALYIVLGVFALVILWLLMRGGKVGNTIVRQELEAPNYALPSLYALPPLGFPTIGTSPYISASNCGCKSCYAKQSLVTAPPPPREGRLEFDAIQARSVQVGRNVAKKKSYTWWNRPVLVVGRNR